MLYNVIRLPLKAPAGCQSVHGPAALMLTGQEEAPGYDGTQTTRVRLCVCE